MFLAIKSFCVKEFIVCTTLTESDLFLAVVKVFLLLVIQIVQYTFETKISVFFFDLNSLNRYLNS